MVDFLCKAGAAVDVPHYDGTTPLMVAIQGNKDAVVKILLEAKADPKRGNFNQAAPVTIILKQEGVAQEPSVNPNIQTESNLSNF